MQKPFGSNALWPKDLTLTDESDGHSGEDFLLRLDYERETVAPARHLSGLLHRQRTLQRDWLHGRNAFGPDLGRQDDMLVKALGDQPVLDGLMMCRIE